METQETPTANLWHRSFWLLSTANLLLTISAYMLIPAFSEWLIWHFSPLQVGVILGSYGLGLFLFGPYCSYLVQHFRRNHVCIVAILTMALLTLSAFLLKKHDGDWQINVWILVLIRFLYGATFGIAQMVLCSTLVIDTCESFQRTQANYVMSWYGRFGVAIGPLLVLVLGKIGVIDLFLLIAAVTCLSSLMIMLVRFPFRAPEDTERRASLDRFFLKEGWPLFLNLVLITIFVGFVLTYVHTAMFYAMMMCGFLIAILSEQLLLKHNVRAEVLVGLGLICLAFLLMGSVRLYINTYIAPVCMGVGIGIVGSAFLLSFLKLSHHCQRGTSQSTFFLSWELGISLGLFVGYTFFTYHVTLFTNSFIIAIIFLLVSMPLYLLLTYPWYVKHKNR